MNKYKILVSDYKQALLNDNALLNEKINKKIEKYFDNFKKGIFCFKPTEKEKEEYKSKLLDENYQWSFIEEEYKLGTLRAYIKENLSKYEYLNLVKDDYFIADDNILEFIGSRLNVNR